MTNIATIEWATYVVTCRQEAAPMGITDQRKVLEILRTYVQDGHTEKALEVIDRSLHAIDGDRLLTTTEAAQLLGIRSVNTLKLLCRLGEIRAVTRGNRTMVPLSEVERVQESERVRGIRASDRVHAAAEELGDDAGLTPRQLEDLEAARPGTLPWEASPAHADARMRDG